MLKQTSILSPAEALAAQIWDLPSLIEVPEENQLHTVQRLDELEQAAHEEGFARGRGEGYAAGYASGSEQVKAQAHKLAELIDYLSRPLARLDQQIEHDIIEMTIEVARRLVASHLQIDPVLAADAVREALNAMNPPPREVRVLLHPDDAKLLADVLTPPPDVAFWRLVPDASLQRGDCRLVTEASQVDGRMDTRVAGIGRALMGEYE